MALPLLPQVPAPRRRNQTRRPWGRFAHTCDEIEETADVSGISSFRSKFSGRHALRDDRSHSRRRARAAKRGYAVHMACVFGLIILAATDSLQAASLSFQLITICGLAIIWFLFLTYYNTRFLGQCVSFIIHQRYELAVPLNLSLSRACCAGIKRNRTRFTSHLALCRSISLLGSLHSATCASSRATTPSPSWMGTLYYATGR